MCLCSRAIYFVLSFLCFVYFVFFFFKQKTAYEMRISDWSSDVCSSDLPQNDRRQGALDLWRRSRDPEGHHRKRPGSRRMMYLTAGLHRALSIRPHEIARIAPGATLDWAAYVNRIARGAAALRALGLRRDDRLVILDRKSTRLNSSH